MLVVMSKTFSLTNYNVLGSLTDSPGLPLHLVYVNMHSIQNDDLGLRNVALGSWKVDSGSRNIALGF